MFDNTGTYMVTIKLFNIFLETRKNIKNHEINEKTFKRQHFQKNKLYNMSLILKIQNYDIIYIISEDMGKSLRDILYRA